jgi:hypothetical protein
MDVSLRGIPYVQFPQYRKSESTGAPEFACLCPFPHDYHPLTGLVVMSTLVLDEAELFSGEIGAKCDSRYAEARK